MQVEHSFFLPLKPNASQRARCACRGGFSSTYTDPKYREWLDQAVPLLKDIAQFEDFRAVADRPVRIDLEVIVARPKTTKLSAPRGDLDNYEKGVWDAITKTERWWKDDVQVVENHTTKRWSREGEPEGYHVRITFL